AGDKADVCYIELTKRIEVSETTDEVLDPLEQKEEKVEDASKITQSKVTDEKPAAKEEAPKKPATKKPTAKEGAPKKPAAKKPAAKKDKPKENWWSRFFK
ncbi:MAG: hypothetical protein VX562_03325, partial [Pseudomonadota bacterium]|nr:hypothetical protein [Pseudomonadota bacterium]